MNKIVEGILEFNRAIKTNAAPKGTKADRNYKGGGSKIAERLLPKNFWTKDYWIGTKTPDGKRITISSQTQNKSNGQSVIDRRINAINSRIKSQNNISKNPNQQTPYPNGYFTDKKSTTITVKKPRNRNIRKKTVTVVEPVKPIVPVETTIPQEQRVASVVPNIPTPPTQITVERTPVTYDRAQTRDVMRMMGYNPYAFTGAQRKQLRQYLNGESDDTSLLSDIDLSKFRNNNTQSSDTPLIATPASTTRRFTIPDYAGQFRNWVQSQPLFSGYAKQGGKLISRNPVKQFKQK